MVNIRKLAAVDIHLHGATFVLIEFIGAIGILSIPGTVHLLRARSNTFSEILTYCYFLSVGLNYVPLLLYSILIIYANSATKEVETGINNNKKSFRKYSTQQFWLLLPLVVLFASFLQEIKKKEN